MSPAPSAGALQKEETYIWSLRSPTTSEEDAVKVGEMMVIEVSSVVPGNHRPRRTAELLKYPTPDECRELEGRDEPLPMEWRLASGEPVETPLYIDVVGSDGILTYVHGRTGSRRARRALKVLVTYNYEGEPAEFRYLEWM